MYIALKDLNLSGMRYMAGENIPEEAVVPTRAAALMRSGYIAKWAEEDKTARGAADDNISVHLVKSSVDVSLRPDEVATVFVILQENAETAAALLNEQDSRNVLMAVKELDSRKGVRAAAESCLENWNMRKKEG